MADFTSRFIELTSRYSGSDTDLGNALGVSKQTISAWKTGKRFPKQPAVRSIASFFGVSIPWLMGITDEEGKPSLSGSASSDRGSEDDLWTLREEEREDPDRKALFMLSKYGSAKDIRQANALIDALKATNPDFYDGDDPA